MYRVADTLPVEELGAGTFLLAGPAMSGKHGLLLELLVEGFDRGDGSLVVTTNQNAASIVSDIESRHGDAPERLGVVDCHAETGETAPLPADRIEHLTSPADLTGIGIGVSEQLTRLDGLGVDRTRVGFDSVSTLLMYTDLETVFRFLHVIVGRIETVGGLGVFTIDPTTHDPDTTNTLKQLFDGMIELREIDDGTQLRVLGVPDASDGWVHRG